jgi:SAM-dependent methyltransferase
MNDIERFTGRVEDYERYRLGYPREMLRTLRSQCRLRWGHFVADIGAGTGLLSQLFLEHGNAVIAIEPNPEMRAACERLSTVWPGLTVKNATAEATGLADASVDVIGVGRAMHWFDFDAAMREFRRILRPGGWVVLAANGRSCLSAQQRELEDIFIEHAPDYKHVKERYRVHHQVAPHLRPESLVRQKIHGEQRVTLDHFLGQVQSYSWTPLPGHPKHEPMQHALREHFDRWHSAGVLHLKTACYVTAGQLV